MKKTLTILMISIFSVCGYAQDWNRELSMQTQLTKTPEATMLDRFQNYPVSNCVGIPDINIPIYTIEAGDLKLPISLSYHLGGHKVNDIATWVGLGWNLNVGGMVSREIKGINDEDRTYGFLNSPELSLPTRTGGNVKIKVPFKEEDFRKVSDYTANSDNIESYFKKLIGETYDMGSDIYSYSINDLSGSFVYDMDRNLVNIPYSDNKIDRDQVNNSFKITDPAGIIYTFSDKEEIYMPNKRTMSGLKTASNWKISTITSLSSSNSIKFTYGSPVVYRVYNRSGIVSVGYSENGSGNQTNNRKLSGSYTEFYERNLTKIEFDNGSIEFTLNSTQRKDKGGHYSLSAIVVKDKQGTVIKRIGFNYTYFQSSSIPAKDADYRLKLESIEIRGNDGSSPLRYTFLYNETPSLPPRWSEQGSSVSLGQDFWGYYNGVTSNQHLVGKISQSDRRTYTFLDREAANRNPSESHMKAWTLKKINYPTGGFSEFYTEANRDKDNKIVGGLRLAQIISRPDAGSTPVTTLYKYENPRYIKLINDNEDYNLYKYRIYIGNSSSTGGNQYTNNCRYYYTEEPFSGLFFHQGSPIMYQKVIKSEQGQGKTEYTYSTPYVYKQNIIANPAMGQTFATSRYPYIENLQSWVMGKPEKEDFYKEGESNPFKSVNYIYTVGYKKRVTIGKHASERYIFNISMPRPFANVSAHYDYFWEEYETGFYKLDRTVETMDGVSTETNYTYGKVNPAKANNIQLTKKEETVNDRTIGHEYKYAQDFTDAISSGMVTQNMVNVALEHITKSDNAHVSTQKRDFLRTGVLYKPASEQIKTGNGTFKTDLTYNAYDTKGNIQQVTTLDGISTIYLWSYNYQYPVAEIKNATYTQVRDILGGQTAVDNIAKSIVLSDADKTKINNLRTSLPNALITTYTYKPLVGMLTATNPSGITTYYGYDTFGRLKETYIMEGGVKKIIQSYDYHYQNQ